MKFRTVKTSEVPEIHQIFTQVEDSGEFALGTMKHAAPCQWEFTPDASKDMIYSSDEAANIPLFPGETIEDALRVFERGLSMKSIKLPPNRVEDELMSEVVARNLASLMVLADKADCHAGLVMGISKALAITIVEDIEEDAGETLLEAFLVMTRDNIEKQRAVARLKDAFKEALGNRLKARPEANGS